MNDVEARIVRTRRAARTRYISALVILALIAIAQFFAVFNQILDQRKQAQVLHIAGKQRMLAVQIAVFSTELSQATDDGLRREYRSWLREDLSELTGNQRLLADAHSGMNPRGWPPPEISRMFGGGAYDIDRSVRIFVRRGSAVIAAPNGRLTLLNENLVYLRDMSGSLAYAFDTLVNTYIASGEQHYDTLLLYEALGLGTLLLTLALTVPLIFRPIERAVKELYERLVRETNTLARAQKTARLGCWQRDLVTGKSTWSKQLREMAGLPDGEEPAPFGSYNHPDDAAAVESAVRRAKAEHTPYCIEHRVITPAGETLWIKHQGEFEYTADGTAVSVFGTAFDISDRKLAEEQAKHFAYFDGLTGLPNRLLLQDRLNQALAGARRSASIVALLSINLDRFKIITDSLGHEAGDLTLRAVAKRLTDLLRASDTVARVAGNEFAIILPELGDGASAAVVADKVIAACAQPYTIDAEELYATASVGIGLYPLDASDAATLMHVAEHAMYKAMEYPGGNYQVSAPEAYAESSSKLALERELRRALERDELVLYYQPIVGRSGRAVGAEALIRWQHPSRGLVTPDIFLPLAEETGLIIPIGDWVLRTACAQAKAWQRFSLPEFRIAVNISTVQFRNAHFLNSLRDVLAASHLPASKLELEITESVVMHDVSRAIDTMRSIKRIGIALSIDDFGTGYSSLAYLKQFPIDTLKIDRSFISDLPGNIHDGAIVQAVLTLARNLALRVVAEGVETKEQLAYLQALECQEIQGFYFSRPIAADAMERWILADVQHPVSAGSP